MRTKVIETKYWTLSKYGPHKFSAHATIENYLCGGEYRMYFSQDAFERDFGPVDFEQPSNNSY